ncbi:MAG: ABC transporter permease [Nitrospirae bacterium]|nr:ABC transporter permease [Nitrospirota bacterium]
MQRANKSLRFLPVFGVVVLWQAASSAGLIPENRLPSPVAILHGFTELATEGLPPGYTLVGHCIGSLKRVLSGVALALASALPLGMFMGYWGRVRDILTPFVEMVRPIPPLAWVPIAILWFGIGDKSAAFIIFLGAFFPILLNTVGGVMTINKRLIESSLILGAGKGALFMKVLAPAAMPSIITGIRIALGIGWMTLVAAEFTGVKSGYGLGYMIMTARDIQRPDLVVAGMAIIGVIGFAMDFIIRKMEQRVLKWR